MTTTESRLVVAYGHESAHELLRSEAAIFHDVPESHLVVVHECPRCGSSAHGRPRLMPTAALRRPAFVSVSRAGGLSMVAVTDAGPVGVDVEADGAAGFAGFDAVALHPSERASSESDRTRVWVRKEALLKAYGLGLGIDPREVALDDAGIAAWATDHPRPDASWLRDLDVPGHVASVAVLPVLVSGLIGLSVRPRPATT